MARSIARQAAMQLLYERLSGGDADDESLDLVYEQLSMAQPEGSAALRPTKDEKSYIDDVLSGVEQHQAELDGSIEKHSTGSWAFSRVPHVDLSILRLAAYEMYHRSDVPDMWLSARRWKWLPATVNPKAVVISTACWVQWSAKNAIRRRKWSLRESICALR